MTPPPSASPASPLDQALNRHFAQVNDALELLQGHVSAGKLKQVTRLVNDSIHELRRTLQSGGDAR